MRLRRPPGTGAVLDSEGPLNLIIVSRRVAVFWTAFCMFLQRWRILVGWASRATGGPVFTTACPRQIAETSMVDIVNLRGLGAGTKYRSTTGTTQTCTHNMGYPPIPVLIRRRK